MEPEEPGCDMDGAEAAVMTIFGIATVSRAAACEKDKDAIFNTAKEYLKDAFSTAKSFKVESKRSDKRFPMTSIQLSQYVGGLLAEEYPQVKVDVHTPELTVNIEAVSYTHLDVYKRQCPDQFLPTGHRHCRLPGRGHIRFF